MKRTLPWLLALCMLLLAGCTETYPPPAPRSLMDVNHTATADGQLAIAMDPTGAKHILRAVCPTGAANPECTLTYEMTRQGEVGALWYFTPAGGYTFRNPEVTVTDSNVAYLIWQNCPADNLTGRLCSTWYTTSDDMSAHVLDPGTHSLSAPILASRGETVYAVHEVTNGYAAGSALRYCRVSDISYACHWVSDHPAADDGVRRTDAAAAVSAAGSLHVAWLQGTGNARTGFYNDNAGTLNGDMAHKLQMETGPFLPPAVGVESDDGYVYIALSADEKAAGSSDWMQLYYCAPANCSGSGGVKAVDLPAAKGWYFIGGPSAAASDDRMWIAFATVTSDHPTQSDIYLAGCFPDSSTCTPFRPYPTTLNDYDHDCDPRIGLIDGWFPVVGWHICGIPPVRGNVYFYGGGEKGGYVIHESDSNGRGGLDMAVNGEWVAGIWNEARPDGRIETWLAFNAKMTYLPAVRR